MNQKLRNSGLQLVSASPHKATTVDHLAAYRPYTRALLRRYFRVASDIGRLPSVLGGLCFRARISNYRLSSFEDAVIFVHDIERVLTKVEALGLDIIAAVILLDYSIPQAARRLNITVQRAERRYAAALDSLSAALLESQLLRPVFSQNEEEAHAEPAPALPPKKPPVAARIDAQIELTVAAGSQ